MGMRGRSSLKASVIGSSFIIILFLGSTLLPGSGAWTDGPSANAANTMSGGGPFLTSELIFPLEHWHNHASMVVEAANGDLITCWFHGSGERQADDVKIEGSRLRIGAKVWEPRFTMADTPGYPDTNCTLFIDPQQRLWLFWPTILANEWHTALMKYKISSHYAGPGAPRWERSDVLHITPGPEFEDEVGRVTAEWEKNLASRNDQEQMKLKIHIARIRKLAVDKLSRRIGWMTRAHPFLLDGKRLIVPLYSDGFSFSLMAWTDDWGNNWKSSRPLIGEGNIQPSIIRKRDGSIYTLMRDNGPAPHRLHQSLSRDRGESWSPVTDSSLPNPGAGAEIIGLKDGHWALIFNDTEKLRNRLAVSISDDEGASWKWKRYLENDPDGTEAGSFHYPSIIQSRDGSLHATYSYHLNRKDVEIDKDGNPRRKSIKHVHFNEAWVLAGIDAQ